jgi:hypothetical protein
VPPARARQAFVLAQLGSRYEDRVKAKNYMKLHGFLVCPRLSPGLPRMTTVGTRQSIRKSRRINVASLTGPPGAKRSAAGIGLAMAILVSEETGKSLRSGSRKESSK